MCNADPYIGIGGRGEASDESLSRPTDPPGSDQLMKTFIFTHFWYFSYRKLARL
jgi:hypothetical protein